jgi:hypothetical protein
MHSAERTKKEEREEREKDGERKRANDRIKESVIARSLKKGNIRYRDSWNGVEGDKPRETRRDKTYSRERDEKQEKISIKGDQRRVTTKQRERERETDKEREKRKVHLKRSANSLNKRKSPQYSFVLFFPFLSFSLSFPIFVLHLCFTLKKKNLIKPYSSITVESAQSTSPLRVPKHLHFRAPLPIFSPTILEEDGSELSFGEKRSRVPKPLKKYLIGRVLGKGAFGKVREAYDTENKIVVAIKIIKV